MTRPLRHMVLLLLGALVAAGAFGQPAGTLNGLIYPTVSVQAVLDLSLMRHNASAINIITSSQYQDGVQVRRPTVRRR